MVATLLLGIKSGLLLGSSGLGRFILVIYSVLLGVGLWFLAFVFNGRAEVLADFIDNYTFVGGLLAAGFLIYLSFKTPSESGQGLGAKLWALLPCPFCVLALALTVVLLAPLGDGLLINWGTKVAVFFTLLVLAVSFTMRFIVRTLGQAPHRVLNSLLLVLGVMTLVFALVTPNVVAVLQLPLKPLELNLLVAGANLILVTAIVLNGYFIRKRQMGRGC